MVRRQSHNNHWSFRESLQIFWKKKKRCVMQVPSEQKTEFFIIGEKKKIIGGKIIKL